VSAYRRPVNSDALRTLYTDASTTLHTTDHGPRASVCPSGQWIQLQHWFLVLHGFCSSCCCICGFRAVHFDGRKLICTEIELPSRWSLGWWRLPAARRVAWRPCAARWLGVDAEASAPAAAQIALCITALFNTKVVTESACDADLCATACHIAWYERNRRIVRTARNEDSQFAVF